jgi:hypothetical protein
MPAMWNPEMGIKFGGMGPPPNQNQNQNQNQGQGQGGQRSPGWQPPPGSGGGTWDPNRGFTFG